MGGKIVETRARIVQTMFDLGARNGYPPTVGMIAQEYGAHHSFISRHLKALREQGVVHQTEGGVWLLLRSPDGHPIRWRQEEIK